MECLLTPARTQVGARVEHARDAGHGLDAEQTVLHGLAWLATYVRAPRQMPAWFDGLHRRGEAHKLDRTLLLVAFGEYLAQVRGGLLMSQTEFVCPADLGL